MKRQPIKHCRNCGHSVTYQLPDDGDTRERAICRDCQTIHYENPLNVVGTVPYWADSVLLCRRNIEPRKGLWTLPAGFMELGETTEEGAARETREESGASFEIEAFFSMVNIPHVGQVHFFYTAKLLNTSFYPGPETVEAKLFRYDEIPWADLAFTTVKRTLECFVQDRTHGILNFHAIDIK